MSLNSEDTSKNKTSTKTPIPRTKPTAPESADEHNVILNNLANEVQQLFALQIGVYHLVLV